MSSTLINKLSLVGSNGISIAQYPEPENSEKQDQQQLEGGLLSAIMSFSREVHQQELEGMSLGDRVVTFIKLKEFFIVAEYNNAIDRDLIDQINNHIEEKANELFQHKSFDNINSLEGTQILMDLSDDQFINDKIEDIGLDRPLSTGRVVPLSKSNFSSEINEVSKNYNTDTGPLTFMLPLENENRVLYVLMDENKNGAHIELPLERAKILFKMVPFLNKEAKDLFSKNLSPEEILEKLLSIPDVNLRLDNKDQQFISLKTLQNSVGPNFDQVITGIIMGKPIIVIGDQVSVKIVATTLKLFVQHLSYEIVEWLEGSASSISRGLTGMSPEKFNDMENDDALDGEFIKVNLDTQTVNGGDANKYVQSLFENATKKSDFEETRSYIQNQLNSLVEKSLEIASFAVMKEKKAKKKVREIENDLDNVAKFNLIRELTVQRNPVLADIIIEISEAVKGVEDFLAGF